MVHAENVLHQASIMPSTLINLDIRRELTYFQYTHPSSNLRPAWFMSSSSKTKNSWHTYMTLVWNDMGPGSPP